MLLKAHGGKYEQQIMGAHKKQSAEKWMCWNDSNFAEVRSIIDPNKAGGHAQVEGNNNVPFAFNADDVDPDANKPMKTDDDFW